MRSQQLQLCSAKLSDYLCVYGLQGGFGVTSKFGYLVHPFRCWLFALGVYFTCPFFSTNRLWMLSTFICCCLNNKSEVVLYGFQGILACFFWTHVFCIHLFSQESIFHWFRRSGDLILHLVKSLLHSLHTCSDVPQTERAAKRIWAPSYHCLVSADP